MSNKVYFFTKGFSGTFEQAEDAIRNALTEQGFGILTEIDVQATLKKKLDVDYDKYIILGACNPPFAYQALQVEPEIGLLLPCNVIVYEKEGRVSISILLPTVMLGLVNNPKITEIANQVEFKLIKALNEAVS